MGNAKRIARRLAIPDGLTEQVREMLDRTTDIDAREAALLKMRFGLDGGEPMTFKDIGERVGLPKDRVSRVLIKFF